jgi:hypothetical protein
MTNPSYEKVEISPFPSEPSIQISDRVSTIASTDAYFHEQLVRSKEIQHLKYKLKWCYQREGVNHFEECRVLSKQYLEILKEMQGG